MLVLSRKEGETLVFKVGEVTFTVTILSQEGKRTRLGIEAPASVQVLRKELLDQDQPADVTP